MKTVLDILKEKEFRDTLEAELKKVNSDYRFTQPIPPLFKYSSFSKYVVDNIANHTISFSVISSFNDNFDSTMSYGNIQEKANKEYAEDNSFHAHYGEKAALTLEEYTEFFMQLQNNHRNFLDQKYCQCFSECNSTVLMWSHYANNNKGICVEYDFETIKNKNSLYYSLLPVIYTTTPIDVYDFATEKKGMYSIEKGLVISLLNKSEVWKYEREWRLFLLDATYHSKVHINLNPNVISAKRIILGYNFIDNFFEELLPKKAKGSEKTPLEETIELFERFINIIKTNNIPISIMLPVQNSFELKPLIINDTDEIYNFIKANSAKNRFTLKNRHMLYTEFCKLIAKQYRFIK